MSQLHKQRFPANIRVDKPDFDNLQTFVADDFKAYNRHFLTDADKWIVKGFEVTLVSGLNVEVAIADACLFNTEEEGANEFYLGESTHAALTATMTNNTTNYVHIRVITSTGVSANRVFWDPTLNSGEGGEFLQTIDTEEFLDVELFVSTSGFSTDADLIPLATIVTSGGAISSITDNRNLFFRLGKGQTLDPTFSFTLSSPTEPASTSFTGADKDIHSFKDWMDLVMTSLKDMKGTTYWYESAPTNLSSGSIAMTGGGVFSWDSGTGVLAWDAAITFLIPATPYTNTIAIGNATLTNNQVAYVDIDRSSNAALTVTVVNSSAFVYASDRLIIARRISDVIYVGYDSMLRLDTGESGQLVTPLTTQTLTYIGAASESVSSPTYSSTNIISNGDSLTTAIGKLDDVAGAVPSSFVVGDILYASSTSVLSRLADVATGNALISGGVGVAPSYGKITINHVTPTTGTDNFVFSTSPTITTPVLTTPTITGGIFNGDSAFDTNVFYVDSVNNRTYFGATTTTTVAGTSYLRQITNAGNNFDAKITTTSATQGIIDAFWHNKATPAAADDIWEGRFYGNDSAGNITEYGLIALTIDDPTNGSEDGSFNFSTFVAGALTTRLSLGATNAVTGDTNFDSGTFFVDAANNRVCVGTTTPISLSSDSYKFSVVDSDNEILALETTATGTSGVFSSTYHNSSSPLANDIIFYNRWYGNDSAANQTEYGRIEISVPSVTDGSESCTYNLALTTNGTLQDVFTATSDGAFSFTSTLTSTTGVVFETYHNSTSPSDSDDIFKWSFYGENSVGSKFEFARILMEAADVTDGTEDARFSLMMVRAGGSITTDPSLEITSTQFIVGAALDVIIPSSIIEVTDITSLGQIFSEGHNTTALAANCYIDPISGEIGRSTSSKRYKEKISDWSVPLSFLQGLRPVSFTHIEKQTKHIGLIAEEVAELEPMFIEYNKKGEPDGIQYPSLTVPLISGWQYHETKIAELEAKIKNLESRLQ